MNLQKLRELGFSAKQRRKLRSERERALQQGLTTKDFKDDFMGALDAYQKAKEPLPVRLTTGVEIGLFAPRRAFHDDLEDVIEVTAEGFFEERLEHLFAVYFGQTLIIKRADKEDLVLRPSKTNAGGLNSLLALRRRGDDKGVVDASLPKAEHDLASQLAEILAELQMLTRETSLLSREVDFQRQRLTVLEAESARRRRRKQSGNPADKGQASLDV